MYLLSRLSVIRTVGSRRSKKQSRSTRRGLRMDTNLVEFRQLQKVREMDSRDCSKCQKSRKLTHWELLEFLIE